jgi:argininosuccinate lyase
MTKLWGGNYAGEPDRAFWEFNRSFGFDRRLLAEEVAASRAWARALSAVGAISEADADTLVAGLAAVLEKAREDAAYLDTDDEDVHSFVESRLEQEIGDLAGQAHLGRSRNEQVATALRLWMRGAIDRLREGCALAVDALVAKGLEGADALMPGFTHTRAAEPITFGHFAAAHAWPLVRDAGRLRDARVRVDQLPLGSGALAGSTLPMDRLAMARELGFAAVTPNALDAVGGRDVAAEFVFACAQLQTHLSRLAEDLIWYSAPEIGFVTLPEAFTTGSSLMPQKKNPDALELLRGKAARVQGDLTRLLVLQKALAVSYQKDLQEDKEAVFDAADTAEASLAIAAGVVGGLGLERARMKAAAGREDMLAATLAVALAREGVPFRRAHGLVGSWVARAVADGSTLRVVAEKHVGAHAPGLAGRMHEVLDPAASVAARSLPGGTAPDAVRASLREAEAEVRSS